MNCSPFFDYLIELLNNMENEKKLFEKTSAQEVIDFLEKNNFEILKVKIYGNSIDSIMTFKVYKILPYDRE
jgi:hypothetical protein